MARYRRAHLFQIYLANGPPESLTLYIKGTVARRVVEIAHACKLAFKRGLDVDPHESQPSTMLTRQPIHNGFLYGARLSVGEWDSTRSGIRAPMLLGMALPPLISFDCFR